MRAKIIFAVIFSTVCQSANAGGDLTNLQGIGMARTYTAIARGINSVGINPANLGYPDKGTVTFNLFNFGTKVGSDLIDLDLYEKYFTGDKNGDPIFLNDADKRKILEVFPSGLAQTGFNFEFKLLSFSYQHSNVGGFVVSILERTGANVLMPKDYVQFLLYGNPLGSRYDFSQTYFNSIWYREYSLSYGRKIPRFVFMKSMTAGISVKMIHGFGFAELSRNNTHFTTDANAKIAGRVDYQAKFAGVDILKEESDVEYSPFPKPAGSGYGIDFGVSGFVNDQLSIGIALTDVGAIKWKQNTYENSGNASFDFDDPRTAEEQFNNLDTLLNGTNKPIKNFSSGLPTVLRIGAAYQFDKAPFISKIPGELLLALDYNQGFNNLAGNTTKPRFSFGVEYKPWKWLPLRTGVSLGGVDGFNMGFGFGILFSFMDIEFSSENFDAAISPRSVSRVSFAFGMKVRI
ncbi:MAG: DUF5723 family protein [Bacteroidota bacterium]|nr:DUF5723 family protein [Bacteroidota bacterium]